MKGSDLDICILKRGEGDRSAHVRTLRKFAKVLRRSSASHYVAPRLGAEVPILRWGPRRPGPMTCDISVNNSLAVVNSRLIMQYLRVDDRLRQMAVCVKTWARRRGINERSKGTISSFALVLMLIHFLQRRSPPILPSLQDMAVKDDLMPVIIMGIDCRYSTDEVDVQNELQRLQGDRPPNAEKLGLLIYDFFKYLGYTYKSGTISIRDGSHFIPRDDEGTCYLVVDNPFEFGKDVANIDESWYTRLREEFCRAHSILGRGGSFKEVCAALGPPGACPLRGAVQPGINAFMGARHVQRNQ